MMHVITKTQLPLNQLQLITFGAPRAGGKSFAKYLSSFSSAVQSMVRVVNKADLVPHVPPQFIGYSHVDREIWHVDGKLYKCAEEGEDAKCASSVHLKNLNIQDHFGYLGVSLSNDICDSFSIPSKQ
jgi:predicted lipase